MPAFMQEVINPALVPKKVIALSWANFHSAHQQPACEQVPHHPASGGEPEKLIVRFNIKVQRQAFEMLKQDPTVPLNNGLGQAGRAGGIEHPEWVIKGHLLELKPGVFRQQIMPWYGVHEIC